jgi:hypothetical protein
VAADAKTMVKILILADLEGKAPIVPGRVCTRNYDWERKKIRKEVEKI